MLAFLHNSLPQTGTSSGVRQPYLFSLTIPESGALQKQASNVNHLDPSPNASLLIWHKKIQQEMHRAMQLAYERWPARLHSPPPYRFREFSLHEYPGGNPQLPAAIRERYPVPYEDEYIIVFDLQSRAATGGGPTTGGSRGS